jgi:hypothetical protein
MHEAADEGIDFSTGIRTAWRNAAMVLFCLGVCCSSPAAAVTDEDVVELKRSIEELRLQNRKLTERIGALEAEKSAPKPASRPAPVTAPPPPERITKNAGEERPPAADRSAGDLEQRVKELELAKTAQQSATRQIIQESMAKSGSKINEFVTFGGAIEVLAGRSSDFSGQQKDSVTLNTAELDFEIKMNDWIMGNLILQYDNGTSVLFPTSNGFNMGVDRITVDRATVTLGDVQKFPLFVRVGRDVLPFGISTGVHRADLLSIDNPLSVEVFETRRNSVGIGFALPTPPVGPPPKSEIIPPVHPVALNPLISSFSQLLGYKPIPTKRKSPTPTPLPPEPPPFYGELFVYDANTVDGVNRRFSGSLNGRLGYRTNGHCDRPYDELRDSYVCPWSFDLSVDYISSVFDSNFLENEYRAFIPRIGKVPGMAASLKMTLGPFSLLSEWNGAIRQAKFVDDAGRPVKMMPSAWQVSLAYQFDWNPWLETIGSQGTYVALGYSRSHDLAGVTFSGSGTPTRVGFVPESRLIVTAAEWVLEGTRVALEYSHNWDYATGQHGTGRQADGLFLALTHTW